MKIALIGTGKTGSLVASRLRERHDLLTFNRSNQPTIEKIKSVDAVVVFLPASGLTDLAPLLLESGIPVILGTTGFNYDALPKPNAPWIYASNFSIGMNIMFYITKRLARISKIQKTYYKIDETHHTQKKDTPSGTALRLKSYFNEEVAIDAKRLDDVCGIHKLTTNFSNEILRLEHEALDRSVFADGVVFTLEELLPNLPSGLYAFEDLFENKIQKEIFYV
ncbi:MAG: hypothetical protein M9962_10060 [Oligoflexia bacterium]|nr:hypothetical protein [Oligoflexia bacterium]